MAEKGEKLLSVARKENLAEFCSTEKKEMAGVFLFFHLLNSTLNPHTRSYQRLRERRSNLGGEKNNQGKKSGK